MGFILISISEFILAYFVPQGSQKHENVSPTHQDIPHEQVMQHVADGHVDGVHYERTRQIKRKFLSGFGDKTEKREAQRLRTIENLKRKAHKEGEDDVEVIRIMG
jgi:hypothetical protein